MSEFSVTTRRREETVDVTERVQELVAKSGVQEGICVVYTPHTTCGMAVNEGYDPAVQDDFLRHLQEVVPRESDFEHAEGNSDAHIKAMLVGTSAALTVSGARARLGRWQAIFLCEFDGPRQREVWVTVTGSRGEAPIK